MELTDLERNEIQNLLYGYDCEHIPQLKEAADKIFDYVQKLVGQIEPPVGMPSRTNSETLLECNMENKYSIEPHGDGYAIYYGRCMHRHGYNLAHLTECEEKFIKIIEEALNEKSVKP